MNPVILALTIAAVSFAAGVGFTVWLYTLIFSRVALYQRTGRPTKAPLRTPHMPGGEMAPVRAPTQAQGYSAEAQAAERARQRIVERGAYRMMEADPSLTPDEARAKAETALRETGAWNPAGGDVPTV